MKTESYDAIAAKAAPSVAYLGATIWGLSIPDWAALLACVYTLGLLVQMAYRWYHFMLRKRAEGEKRAKYGADPDDPDAV